ncbi:hypothetical protein TNCV_2299321 [Trichonephila clavipes]|nr:hypothetical protein TNCV_2299321 [Trichonephila clavipes]
MDLVNLNFGQGMRTAPELAFSNGTTPLPWKDLRTPTDLTRINSSARYFQWNKAQTHDMPMSETQTNRLLRPLINL